MKHIWKNTLAAACGLLLVLPSPVNAQEQEGPPPELLLNNATTYYHLGRDKVDNQSGDPTNDFNEAIKYFHRYMETVPNISFADSVGIYTKLADSWYQLSSYADQNSGEASWPKALEFYEWLIERNPPEEELSYNYFCAGYAKSRLEGWVNATSYLEKYMELRPDDLENRKWVARIYLSIPNYGKALDHFLLYLDQNPADEEVIAEILNLRNRLSLRYEEITLKLVEKLPDTPQYLLDLGQHYLTRAEFDKGVEYLEKYLGVREDDISAWKILGDEWARRVEFDKALDSYRKILAVDSRNIIALADISSAYLKMRNIDEAVRYADRALAIDSEDPYSNRVMGDAGVQWAFREYHKMYPGREDEKMMYDFKLLMKRLADEYYTKAKADPQHRGHAQSQINYLTQFFPQSQDRFMWDKSKDEIIKFPPPR